MSNSDLYHFADFTRQNYHQLLRLAKQNFTFRTYLDFHPDERFVIWRHDVDFSMHAARRLAQIEAAEGVVATYFLHLHNIFYNLLEREITNCVKDILALGHHIGLHFDSHFYGVSNEEQLDKYLLQEKIILEKVFELRIHAFSFHIVTPFTMSCKQWQYSNLINTYAEYFQTEVGYCSDSNGYWRYRRLEDVLREARDTRLQVLTHPAWWQEAILSPKERILRCIEGRAEKTKYLYAALLKEYGREDIDWK